MNVAELWQAGRQAGEAGRQAGIVKVSPPIE